ncbi:hypothetical protein NDI56_19235 [Haloarcula sp. S1CR25-12]|uniref:DUF8156 domain-containing protein n=1 Tax=Haloarcula saliterrae TaxID=2950534 RepID=A0ABU2FH06_9EURY|nr:hypothetical protein [Haloarcula sp. S1CR25-12]MDS0261539.1 hypothetical protein [Haloarcula sp. S1CR25-12]
MGRTNPTFRDALGAIEDRWQTYRRALRRRDQPRFDRLFAYARAHADAAGLLNHGTPLLPTLLSVALEQERRLDDHAERLDALEAALDDELRAAAPDRSTAAPGDRSDVPAETGDDS